MGDGWSSADFADAEKRGDLDPELIEDAGKLDDIDAIRLQKILEHYWPDDVDKSPDDWGLGELMSGIVKSESVQRAVSHGNDAILRRYTGSRHQSSVDMADWNKYEQIKDLFREEPKVNSEFTNRIFQAVIFSSRVPPTGRGKSNTMYTLFEFAQTVYPGIRILTNNTSDPFETTPENWSDLERTIREHDGWMALGIDEAAQFLQYADQGAGKTVSQMLKLLRHNRCHLIMVGHTGMDIPADIRRQMFFLDKKSQKQGVLGYGLTSSGRGNTMEVAEEVLRLDKIPATNVEYDDIDDEGIQIKFGEDERERSGGDDEIVRCEGEKGDGSRCGTTSVEDPLVSELGVCRHHIDQREDDNGGGDE